MGKGKLLNTVNTSCELDCVDVNAVVWPTGNSSVTGRKQIMQKKHPTETHFYKYHFSGIIFPQHDEHQWSCFRPPLKCHPPKCEDEYTNRDDETWECPHLKINGSSVLFDGIYPFMQRINLKLSPFINKSSLILKYRMISMPICSLIVIFLWVKWVFLVRGRLKFTDAPV